MINPSAPGWIDKFFNEQKFSEAIPFETKILFTIKSEQLVLFTGILFL